MTVRKNYQFYLNDNFENILIFFFRLNNLSLILITY